MGVCIARFEGHEGPVRCVDFHPTQPIFVSCGDDGTIRIWSLQTQKLMFQLNGHFDYVRTAYFHPEMPWVISASDDQTVRIWNWQNRQQLLCLTSHSHWVTCAQFHPTEDLIASSSLDCTVRIYDISALRRRLSAPSKGPMEIEEAGPDAFGPQYDYRLKWTLEGHSKGVLWVAFHPTQPLLASASDDKTVRLWRMSDSRAWEVDTLRGHTNSVTCVAFHLTEDLILSCSDDRTFRTWDLNRRIPVNVYKRENEKFWNIALHPNINLIGATNDGGLLIFKLARERPAHTVSQGKLYFATRDKKIKIFDYKDAVDKDGVLSLAKFGGNFQPLRELSYNPAENAVLVTCDSDGNPSARTRSYILAKLPAQAMGPVEPSKSMEGPADQAQFITRNRFAVFRAESQTIEIRDMENSITKTLSLPIVTKHMLSSQPGHVLLAGANSVVLFDVQQGRAVATLRASDVEAAVWSPDGKYVALQAKHKITIANSKLEFVSSVNDTIRVKSVAWDEAHTVIYSTFNHLKYALLNGDVGVLKTLNSTLYVTMVKGNTVYCLSRNYTVFIIRIDSTEYRFKKAIINGDFAEVARLIKTSHLVGQSIIAYLQKRGYPEIALQFVEDPQTKFDLAIECGDLNTAAEQAGVLNKPIADKLLAAEALNQGNHDILEDVYQKQRAFDKLAFLYLITGNRSRLQKMEEIADARGDTLARFQTSIFLNSVENRAQLLREAGQAPLAYATAKSNGLGELASQIAAEQGIDESKIDIPVHNVAKDNVVGVSIEGFRENWPLHEKKSAEALLTMTSTVSDEPTEYVDEVQSASEVEEDGFNDNLDALDDLVDGFDDIDVNDEGWDLDVDVGEEEADVQAVSSTTVVTEKERWVRNSTVPADHVAAGSFETAAQLLNRQAGIVNFAPLKRRFLEVYEANKAYITGHDGLPPLEVYVRGNNDVLPYIPGFDSLGSKLQEAYKFIKAAKLELAIETFREILYTVLILSVDESDVPECLKVVEICRNYILAFSIELKRRSLPASETKRNLELAAYFTKPTLRPAHAPLPLQVALTQAFQQQEFALASYFAGKYLELVKTGPGAEKVRKIKARCDANPLDKVDIDFDQFANFTICPGTLTPIYESEPTATDPFTGAVYHASEKGKLCSISGISVIGAAASGLRLSN